MSVRLSTLCDQKMKSSSECIDFFSLIQQDDEGDPWLFVLPKKGSLGILLKCHGSTSNHAKLESTTSVIASFNLDS